MDSDTSNPQVSIRRPVYQQDELHRIADYAKPKTPIGEKLKKRCEGFDVGDFAKRSIPFIDWMSKYKWKTNFTGDIIAGVTVAVMHVPQGMAYAMLGNVPPIVGLYMAFFPVLVYVFLGTSRHNSMGSFAVVSLMIGKVVASYAPTNEVTSSINNGTTSSTFGEADLRGGLEAYTPVEVATVVTFMVGLMQLAMYVLRLGILSTLLSDTLVSGFTTGAAIHVLTSQIKDLLGLRLPRRVGVFKIILTYVDVFADIDDANITALILSALTIIVLTINNQILKPMVSKRCIVPVPIEAIVVLVGTIVSVKMNLAETYNVVVVGTIPIGLPEPRIPKFELIPSVWLDSMLITIISYAVSLSMALIFAQRNNYEVDSNQELIAQGVGNVFGSFFSCMPFAASLSRSSIQEMVGGRTQIASVISCSLLLCILLWVGPFFETLPKCILASIIVVALRGMLLQVREFFKYWRLSRVDGGIWMATFLTVVFIDIEYGLGVGVCLSVVSLVASSMRPYACRVGLVPGTEMYLDVKRYKGTTRVPGVEVLHYCGSLNFASRPHFRSKVYWIAGLEPQKELARRSRTGETSIPSVSKNTSEKGYVNEGYEHELGDKSYSRRNSASVLKFIVIDFSALVYIDPSGVGTLRNLVDEFKKIDVTIIVSGCSGPVYETMRKCNVAEGKDDHFAIFPTIGDAVHFALHEPRVSIISLSPTSTRQRQPNCEEDDCTSRL